jgi:hypothetical protein
MKSITFLILISLLGSCGNKAFLKNQTKPGGYALGEKVPLRFATDKIKNPPDSIKVYISEKKTSYRYSVWAQKVGCDNTCEYKAIWDGRKPDGSWPSGGRYFVYGSLRGNPDTPSDTVEIGLGD